MKPYYQDSEVTIYHGDCREIMPTLGQVDLVLTDPPYPREFDWCWSALGEGAAPLMRPGSLLMTYCGHYQLPKVLADIGSHLTYWWLFIARNDSSPAVWGYDLRATFKPVPAFYKETAPTHFLPGLFPDDLKIAGAVRAAKALHEWGQSPIIEPILRFTPAGGVVLDPFMGSGTTLRTAKDQGRMAIGIDVNERHCETAALRMAQEVLPLGPDKPTAPAPLTAKQSGSSPGGC